MSDVDDIMDSKLVRDALSELSRQMHVPAELLLAYARGELSAESCGRIESHLKDCQECRDILGLAEKSPAWEREPDSQPAGSDVPCPMTADIESKLHLAGKVNQKRNDIAASVAGLLLPKDFRPSISLIINAMAKWRSKPSVRQAKVQDKMLAAAFASESGPAQREAFERIVQAVDFTNLACDLVVEHARDLGELEQTLPECVTQAVHILKDVEPNEDFRRKLMAVFMQDLFDNGTKQNIT